MFKYLKKTFTFVDFPDNNWKIILQFGLILKEIFKRSKTYFENNINQEES